MNIKANVQRQQQQWKNSKKKTRENRNRLNLALRSDSQDYKNLFENVIAFEV